MMDCEKVVDALMDLLKSHATETISEREMVIFREEAERKLTAGWSPSDVFAYQRNNEAVDPNIPEDTALARMRAIADKYPKDQQ